MDPELRAYLDAMRAEMGAIDQRAAARDAETRQRVDTLTTSVGSLTTSVGSLTTNVGSLITSVGSLTTEIKATRAVAEVALSVAVQARDGIGAARTEARALHADMWAKIEGMQEGLSTHQRAESDRLDAAREEAMLNHHVLPLEASASSQQECLNDHEKRIRVVEKR